MHLITDKVKAILMQPLIIGIRGTVLALDRATGQELWRTDLKGISFVNVTQAGDQVFATTRGEIYCLNPLDGAILWHNPLKGLGQGLITIALEGCSNQGVVCAEKLQEEAEAASTAAASGAAASATAAAGS